MSHIFISYSSKNRDAARFIAEQLQKRGATVFIDYESLQVGDNFPERLADEIDRCDAVVFLLSEYSAVSRWVRSEIQYAFSKEKHICPIALDSTPAPKSMFFLAATHSIDFKAWTDAVEGELAARKLATALGLMAVTSPPSSPRIQGGEKETAPAAAPPLLVSERGSGGEVRTFPLIIKPDWVGKIISEPFEWCVVPAGSITLTDTGGYLKQATTFEVPEFRIARYPITNAQYEAFVLAEDGWLNPKWWDYSDVSMKYRIQELEPKLAVFADCADCPRETVNWYAAIAFTNWLSFKTGEKILLPTEQQWQRAAQGDDGRIYPWGNHWDSKNCNNSVETSQHTMTTPVTEFALHGSPFGVIDMSGNVWEWCLTGYYDNNRDTYVTEKDRVLKGGSWSNDNPGVFRSAVRMWSSREASSSKIGFRCAIS